MEVENGKMRSEVPIYIERLKTACDSASIRLVDASLHVPEAPRIDAVFDEFLALIDAEKPSLVYLSNRIFNIDMELRRRAEIDFEEEGVPSQQLGDLSDETENNLDDANGGSEPDDEEENAEAFLTSKPVAEFLNKWSSYDGNPLDIESTFYISGFYHYFEFEEAWYTDCLDEMEALLEIYREMMRTARLHQRRSESEEHMQRAGSIANHSLFNAKGATKARRAYLAGQLFPGLFEGEYTRLVTTAESISWYAARAL